MANNIQPLQPKAGVAIGDMLLEDMKRTTEGLKVSLGRLINEAQVSIEEDAFIKLFLPLFAGDFNKSRANYEQALEAWYRVAGSPYAPVNVVRGGRVVAVVPPVRVNVLNGKHSGSVQDVAAMMEDVAHMRTLSPQAARNLEITALHERFLRRIPKPNLSEAQKAWFNLLNQYGRAPDALSASDSKAQTDNKAKAQAADDMFDYGD